MCGRWWGDAVAALPRTCTRVGTQLRSGRCAATPAQQSTRPMHCGCDGTTPPHGCGTCLVDGLHRKVEGHELHNGAQPGERGAHANAGETGLRGGGRVWRGGARRGWGMPGSRQRGQQQAAPAPAPALHDPRPTHATPLRSHPPRHPTHPPTSVMGVSRTRLGPYFCSRPRVIL